MPRSLANILPHLETRGQSLPKSGGLSRILLFHAGFDIYIHVHSDGQSAAYSCHLFEKKAQSNVPENIGDMIHLRHTRDDGGDGVGGDGGDVDANGPTKQRRIIDLFRLSACFAYLLRPPTAAQSVVIQYSARYLLWILSDIRCFFTEPLHKLEYARSW